MFLYDLRLKFARDLIGHWLDIRRGAMVPFDEDIDPRELLSCIDYVAIADLSQPARVIIKLAGARVTRRFGRDIHRTDALDLIPPKLRDTAKRSRERFLSVPCGFYHRFIVTRDGAPTVTAESLSLPLRHRFATAPDAAITISRDLGYAAAGWLSPSARVQDYVNELVDIGAGV